MEELNRYLAELEMWHREHKAKRYSQKVQRVKRKITFDWQSENCTMYVLAGALLFMLATIML